MPERAKLRMALHEAVAAAAAERDVDEVRMLQSSASGRSIRWSGGDTTSVALAGSIRWAGGEA
jgi:hypothetical protein